MVVQCYMCKSLVINTLINEGHHLNRSQVVVGQHEDHNTLISGRTVGGRGGSSGFSAVHRNRRGRVAKRGQNYHLAHMTPCLTANTSYYDRHYWRAVIQPDGSIIWVYIGKDAPWE